MIHAAGIQRTAGPMDSSRCGAGAGRLWNAKIKNHTSLRGQRPRCLFENGQPQSVHIEKKFIKIKLSSRNDGDKSRERKTKSNTVKGNSRVFTGATRH